MTTPLNDENTSPKLNRDYIQANPRDYDAEDIDESAHRVIMARPDEDSAEAAFAYAGGDDFLLDPASDDEPFDDHVFHAADEELSIVNAYEIGIGYGLDEEELARLTGKPD